MADERFPNDPYRPNLADDEYVRAARRDAELQVDPELGEGPASSGKVALFAVAIAFAFSGGLLHLPVAADESGSNRHLALLVLGFLAGFSERWAQDTLTSILPGDSGPPVTQRPPDAAPVDQPPADNVVGP